MDNKSKVKVIKFAIKTIGAIVAAMAGWVAGKTKSNINEKKRRGKLDKLELIRNNRR